MGVIRRVVSVTPVMAAGPAAYAANDQVGAVNTITNAAPSTGGTVEIESLILIDKAKQALALDVFFFDVSPTLVSADNAEFEMTDANLAAAYKGHIKIVAGDYATTKNASVANPKIQGLFLKSLPATKNLYCVVITRGAPTYSNGDLVLQIGLKQGSS